MAAIKTNSEEFRRFDAILKASIPDFTPFYFKLDKNGKDPWSPKGVKDYSWKDGKLTTDEAVEALNEGFNIGIAGTDTDPLAIIDIDDPEKFRDHDFGKTLMVCSGGRIGVHAYNFTYDQSAKINTSIDSEGEIRTNWYYVVAPGSFAQIKGKADFFGRITKTYEERLAEIPEHDRVNAGKYEIIDDAPVREITYADYPDKFKTVIETRAIEDKEIEKRKLEWANKEYVQNMGEGSAFYDIKLADVIRHVPDRNRFPSLFHDSSTGQNAAVSTDGKLLHCWRDGCSHNGIQALAVTSGMYTCVEAGSPHKGSGAGLSKVDLQNGEIVYKLWKYAKEKGILLQDDPIPSVAVEWYAINQGYCKETDVREGWRVPGIAYIKVLKDEGLYVERPETDIKKNENEENIEIQTFDHIDDIPLPQVDIIPPISFYGLQEYNLVKMFVNHISEVSDTYPEYSFQNGIAALSTLVRRRLYFRLNGRKEHPNLITLSLGQSGYARKGASMWTAERMLTNAIGNTFLSRDMTPEGLITEISDEIITTV